MARATRTKLLAGLACLSLAGSLAAQPPAPQPPGTPEKPPVEQAGRQPATPGMGKADSLLEQNYQIQLDVPSMDRVLRVENEQALFERIRQEYRTRNDRAVFPTPVELDNNIKTQLVRAAAPQTCLVHPSFVCYNPLYFQDLNVERYGWELGVLQPLASTAHFYKDLVMLPYNACVLPPWCCDANVGYYNVGEPAPYICYTPPWSWKAAAAELGVFVGGAAVFP